MLRELLRFEWRYHTRQLSFLAAAAFFLLAGFVTAATGFGPKSVHVNSSYVVLQSLGLLSLVLIFGVAIFASSAVIRDPEHKMEEIVYGTPVGRFSYLFSRFGGAFAASLVALLLCVVGMIVATHVGMLDAERVAPFTLLPYLWGMLILGIPNLLFATALVFAIAAWTRSALATYVGAVFVYVLYFVAAAATDSPMMAQARPGAGGGLAGALLDPFGLSAFFELTRYWTPAEKNARLVPLTGSLLLNRVVWICAAAALWGAVYRTFSFRIFRKARAPKTKKLESASRAIPYVTVAPATSATRVWLASFASAVRMELRALLGSIPFLLVLLLWAGLAATEINSEIHGGELGTMVYATSSLVFGRLQQPLWIIGVLLVVYYGAEVFWRERRFAMSPLVRSTPVSGSVVVLAKWVALALAIALTVGVGVVTGVVMQLINGYTSIEPTIYLGLFYFGGLPLMILAAVAALVHALSPSKYVGMIAVLLVALLSGQLGEALGLEHPLWRFTSPSVRYSDMNGFGHDAAPAHWLLLHWAFVAALALGAAALLWRSERLRTALRGASARGRAFAALLLAIPLVTGGWIVYQTDVIGHRESDRELSDWKASYEKKYRPLVTQAQPTIDDVDLNIDLFPAEGRLRFGGRYTLLNDTAAPISSIHVAMRRAARVTKLSMSGAQLAAKDERFAMYRFDLAQPLAPGARTDLHFDLEFQRRALGGLDQDDSIAANGSAIASTLAPTIGYRATHELADPRERAKRGLSPRAEEEEPAVAHGEAEDDGAEKRFTFAATVSTSDDQIAVGPGRLERTWSEGQRRYFRYRTTQRIVRYAIASARYAVKKQRHHGIDVELYYHPGHGWNADRMLRSAAVSLEMFSERFAPYPAQQYRMVEVPTYWPFGAFAMPEMLLMVEDRGFFTDARDARRPDLVTRRVAHEVAHQWWGYLVTAKPVVGASSITESLAKDGELLVIERLRGPAHVRQLLELENDRYLSGRGREEREEPSLERVRGQAYVYYGKGAIVMRAIRGLIGDTAVDSALRAMQREHGPGLRQPTSRDLIAKIESAAPAGARPLIREWMQELAIYDLKIESATAARRADGKYDVVLKLSAAKTKADGKGNESDVPLDEAIEVALYDGHPDASGVAIATQQVRLRRGANEVALVVDRLPRIAAVDPNVTRIDRNRRDNAVMVE